MDESEVQYQLDAIADEFITRRKNGEEPTVDEYVQMHPSMADEISEFLKTLLFVDGVKNNSSEPWTATGMAVRSGRLVQSLPEFDDYDVLREIGRGGMGVVYEARQKSLSRRVALKVLPGGYFHDEAAVERFRLEARSAAGLHHTNIVPVYEVGKSDQHLFYTMQLICGKSLDQVAVELKGIEEQQAGDAMTRGIAASVTGRNDPDSTSPSGARNAWYNDQKQHALTSSRSRTEPGASGTLRMGHSSTSVGSKPFYKNVARIGKQVALALQHAHESGVVHRDIKPANLLLDLNGTVWVTDFGLAKTDAGNLTRTGDVVGTLRYISPERFAGDCDQRSDIYSLGVTLYELLAMRKAFDDSDRLKLIDAIKTDRPESLRKIDARLPRDLETIIEKSMEKEPGRRYATAAEFAGDLTRFINGQPIAARRVGPAEKLWLWARKHTALAMALAAFALLLISSLIGAVVSAYQFRDQAIRQGQLAETNLELANENIAKTAEADEARVAAENTAAEAKRSLKLFTDSFFSASPRGGSRAGMSATEVLNNARRLLDESELDDSSRAGILQVLTESFVDLGDPRSGLSTANDLLELESDRFGDFHPDTLKAKCLLASVLDRAGELDQAYELYEQTLADSKEYLPAGHVQIGVVLNNLAGLYAEMGRYQDSLRMYEEAMSYLEDKPAGDFERLTTRLNIGMALKLVGRLKDARGVYDVAIPRCKKHFGEDSQIAMTAVHGLADVYSKMDKQVEAIGLLESTLELSRTKLGDRHPDTMQVSTSLANCYVETGRTDDAIPLLEDVWLYSKTKQGLDHPITLETMHALAIAYYEKGMHEEENSLLKELLEGTRKNYGDESPVTADVMNSLARSHYARGELSDSVPLFESALKLNEKFYGREHVNTQVTVANLGLNYSDDGQLEKAIPLLKEAYSTSTFVPSLSWTGSQLLETYAKAGEAEKHAKFARQHLRQVKSQAGRESDSYLSLAVLVGTQFNRLGNFEKAEPLLRAGYEHRLKSPPLSWGSRSVESSLGESLMGLGKLEEAAALMNAGYQGLRENVAKIPGRRRDKQLTNAIDRLIKLALAMDDNEAAKKWKSELERLPDFLNELAGSNE